MRDSTAHKHCHRALPLVRQHGCGRRLSVRQDRGWDFQSTDNSEESGYAHSDEVIVVFQFRQEFNISSIPSISPKNALKRDLAMTKIMLGICVAIGLMTYSDEIVYKFVESGWRDRVVSKLMSLDHNHKTYNSGIVNYKGISKYEFIFLNLNISS